jgi:hypothetical protein
VLDIRFVTHEVAGVKQVKTLEQRVRKGWEAKQVNGAGTEFNIKPNEPLAEIVRQLASQHNVDSLDKGPAGPAA